MPNASVSRKIVPSKMTVRMSQMGVSPPRLELPEPIAATFADTDATIIEVSLVGCAVHHPSRVKVGSSVSLQFVWQGKKARIDAKVARSTMQFSGGKPLYVSGLQFADSVEASPAVIRSIIESLVPPPAPVPARAPEPVVAAVASAPAPAPAARVVVPAPTYSESVPFLRFQDDFDEIEPEPEPEPIFLRCRFVEGRWQNERVTEPAQPDDEGFTILAETDDVDGLCKTYEVADPETRKMMRFSFEIAIEQQLRT